MFCVVITQLFQNGEGYYTAVVVAVAIYRLVQIERPKLCPRELLTPFFRVKPRNFAHIFWKAVSKTRRGGFFIWGFAVEISGF